MSNWNDDRLDELADEVRGGFEKVDNWFKEADEQFSEINERLAAIEAKLDGLGKLERLIWGFGSALFIAILAPHLF